jgi:Na+/H+ antiporter NhaD/arsenite permease-like protein
LHASLEPWLTIVLFLLTYLGLVVGEVPRLRMDRAGIAFAGAALMLSTGVLTLSQAVSPDSIDYETLCLLFGMMIVVGFLRLSGVLARLTQCAFDRFHSPHGLLALVILLGGLLSAFLVNDIVCLALTPPVLHMAKRLRFDPIPHLIGLATAANIGSTATITGNPQNMIIGVQSRIPYIAFAAHLMPLAMLGLAIDFLVLSLLCRSALAGERAGSNPGPGESATGPSLSEALSSRAALSGLQWKSAIVAALTVRLFFEGLPMVGVAIGAAAAGADEPEHIYREIDWSLLPTFAGLFVMGSKCTGRVAGTSLAGISS